MFTKYKINTRKKRFAFETIILILTICVCSIVLFLGNYLHENEINNHYKKENLIQSKIDSLKENVFRNRYENLNKNEKINDYSYESYKKYILNDKDSSFRRDIYYRLCNLYSDYRNEKTFEEFVQQFEYDSINQIDEQISNLELKKDTLSNQYPESNEYHIILTIVLLLIIYPLRLIYYLIRWSVNTLKETEEKIENINKNKFDLNKNDIKYQKEITNSQTEKKSKLINYFNFKNEYLTGINYLIRMIIGSITIPIFFIGLLIMSTSVYKRTSSLGFGKSMSIINCILIPILCVLTIMINYTENKFGNSGDPLMLIIPLIFSLTHMILLFKNGTRKKIGKFEIQE
jgi:hypothetical protein